MHTTKPGRTRARATRVRARWRTSSLCLLLAACAPLQRAAQDRADTDATDDTDTPVDSPATAGTLSLQVAAPVGGQIVALSLPLDVLGTVSGATSVTVWVGATAYHPDVDRSGRFAARLVAQDIPLIRVTASAADGDQVVSEIPILPNHPPIVDALALSPAQPTAGQALVASWATPPVDVDGDPLHVRWSWTQDGVPRPDLIDDTVPQDEVRGGEVWSVTAEVVDPYQSATPVVAAVTVLDTLPTGRAVLSPDPPRAGAPARCDVADVVDVDGDAVTTQVTWTVNGGPTQTGAVIPTVHAFDEVRCSAVLSTPPGDATLPEAHAVALPDLPASNVVVVVMDDIGAYDIGAYRAGSDAPHTPTIDALAAQGATFTRAWSNPVCTPSRGSLMTGRYPFRTGVGANTEGSWQGFALPMSETTVAEWLRDRAGYDTSAIGKWHLSTQADPQGPTPLEYGFSRHIGVPANVNSGQHAEFVYDGDYFDWESWVDGVPEVQTGYLTVREIDDALDRLAELQEPWFEYVAVHAAHLPTHAPPDAPTPRGGWTGRTRYKAMIESLDTELARLVDALPADTTLIVLGDNGAPELIAPPPPYSADELKGTPMEGGIRVPLVVRSPYVRTPGVRIDTLVHLVDLFPTLADLARAPVDGSLDLDGRSLVPFLADPQRADPRDVIYSERFDPSGPVAMATMWDRAIRDDRYKVVRGIGVADRCFELNGAFREGADLNVSASILPEQRAGCDRLADRLDRQDVR